MSVTDGNNNPEQPPRTAMDQMEELGRAWVAFFAEVRREILEPIRDGLVAFVDRLQGRRPW